MNVRAVLYCMRWVYTVKHLCFVSEATCSSADAENSCVENIYHRNDFGMLASITFFIFLTSAFSCSLFVQLLCKILYLGGLQLIISVGKNRLMGLKETIHACRKIPCLHLA